MTRPWRILRALLLVRPAARLPRDEWRLGYMAPSPAPNNPSDGTSMNTERLSESGECKPPGCVLAAHFNCGAVLQGAADETEDET